MFTPSGISPVLTDRYHIQKGWLMLNRDVTFALKGKKIDDSNGAYNLIRFKQHFLTDQEIRAYQTVRHGPQSITLGQASIFLPYCSTAASIDALCPRGLSFRIWLLQVLRSSHERVTMKTFDVAVLGLGTMGSFACLEFARRGLRVVGFDRFAPPHQLGSHSGDTRVFRTAYAEHPDYVPLAQRAGDLWDQHSLDSGRTLLHRTGMLSAGPPAGDLITGIRVSTKAHDLKVEELQAAEIHRRWPAFALPGDWVGMFEPGAGWVDVNASIECSRIAAESLGVRVFLNTPVAGWHPRNGRILVETAQETVEVEHLIITAGAWASDLLSGLQLPLSVRRKVLAWIDPASPDLFETGRFPVFAIADRFFYGFPDKGQGVKLAIHWEEAPVVPDLSQPVASPVEEDLAPIVQMALTYLPGIANGLADGLSRMRRAVTCLYTMTPDEHFIIDRHPMHENVWLAAGFSGHGFKFAPAIAEALAELSLEGKTKLPIDFLRIGRRFDARSTKANLIEPDRL